jgi:hypothetical protein
VFPKTRWKTILLHILLPLVLGLIVYLLFRKPSTHLHDFLSIKQPLYDIPRNMSGKFLLFHFPDMCWAYALTASLIVFTTLKSFWCAAIGILAMSCFELIQADLIPGNLDLTDTVLMLLAVILSTFLIKNQ